MSQENVEIMRHTVGPPDAATVLALYDPEVELDERRDRLGAFHA
jgi:hypothetical protein